MSERPSAAPRSWPEAGPSGALLTDEAAVDAWFAAHAGSRLAVDVEADGMFRYRAQLCTMQLADSTRIGVVDTLALPLPASAARMLADARVQKVIHDAAFDARMLGDYGASLQGVFDTAVAVRYLGYAETGLAAILERHFGVRLAKEQQQSDWGLRPLDAAAIGYLHEDVRYLLGLAEVLEHELDEAGIRAEFETECAYVVEQAARAQPDTRQPWMRVKGAAKLRPRDRAVLREAAQAREQFAQDRDVPPGRLIAPGLLIALAERAPRTREPLAKLLRRTGLDDQELATMADAVTRGLSAGDVPADELAALLPTAPPPEVRALHKRRRAALTALRAAEAEQRGVDLQVVLPGHCLKDLTGLREVSPEALAGVPGLGACRLERYGAGWLKALQACQAEAAS